MSALPQSTRRKLSLLDLAQELGNVSKACQYMAYHRSTFTTTLQILIEAKSTDAEAVTLSWQVGPFSPWIWLALLGDHSRR
jgi:hypothetical protein